MPELWIDIPNWEKFQHYKDRNAPWIKNYPELISRDAYRRLSMHQRGVLHSIWLEYARSGRQLRGDTLTLTRQLGHRVVTRDLEALNHAGFIELVASTHKQGDAANVLATRAPAPSQEGEGEGETENPKTNPVPEPEPEPRPPAANGAGAGAGGLERIDPHAYLREIA